MPSSSITHIYLERKTLEKSQRQLKFLLVMLNLTKLLVKTLQLGGYFVGLQKRCGYRGLVKNENLAKTS